MPKIAIIVLNWKQPQLTIDTINSLVKIKTQNFSYQIFIIDNGSPDNSVDSFKKYFNKNPNIKIYETGSNLGYVGNNFGIKKAIEQGFDYILLINNDVIVDKLFLEELFKGAQLGYDIVGPKIYFAPGFEYHYDWYSKNEIGNIIWSAGGRMDWNNIYGSNIGVDQVDKGQFDNINEQIDFLTGCCLLIKIEVFKKIGLLDEKYFMYLEDVDFCQRAKKLNLKLAYIPTSKIWHVNSGSSKSGGELHDYFITRNRLLYGFKYANIRTKFALFRESIKQFFSTKSSQWKKRGIIDFYIHKLNKGSWQ
jgi:GT2 family glycosyltransferase